MSPILLEEFAKSLWSGDPDFALPASLTAQPPGLEAVLEYNGIYIHDRTVVDKYRVTSIDGLHGGPDIRFNEESIPGSHGMSPLQNLLGGRTFILEGHIAAGNIGRLRDLEQALRTAFYSMIERPLVLHTGDATRDVFILSRINDKLGLKDEQTKDDRITRDFQITMRASNPRIFSTNLRSYEVTLGVLDDFSADDLADNWAIESGAFSVASGVLTATGGATPNVMHYANLGYKPIDSQSTIKFTTPASPTNGDEICVMLKETSPGNYLIARVKLASTTTAVIQFCTVIGGTVTPLGSPTATFAVAGSNSYWIEASSDGNLLTAQVFSTDPAITGTPLSAVQSYTLSAGAEQTEFGTGVGGDGGVRATTAANCVIDNFRIEPLSFNNQLITPRHAGNFLALPIIQITGPMTDVQIINETMMPDEGYNRYIKINGDIPAGRTYIYDASLGTLVDDLGVRQDAQLDVGSRQLQLSNGDNDLTLVAASASDITPAITVSFRDTWL